MLEMYENGIRIKNGRRSIGITLYRQLGISFFEAACVSWNLIFRVCKKYELELISVSCFFFMKFLILLII